MISSTVPHSAKSAGQQRMLAFAALGVVFGDIGTSPLYAIKECFHMGHDLAANTVNILGILSLMFWSLTLVVVVKYLTFVMRADNRGEGGILTLLSLVSPRGRDPKTSWQTKIIVTVGLIGAALLVADSTITPAISVLGAVEGVLLVNPAAKGIVPMIAAGIIVILFLFQKKGTEKVGIFFAPFMVIWFLTIGALGLPAIINRPDILLAINPYYAFNFFYENQWNGFMVLGSVVLCITGVEALYADMGHFGVKAIKRGWYLIVFPGLLLNYFGQGALLLERGAEVIDNPFYELAPSWFLYPLIGIATAAAIIASQALISGAYSLAQQAVQMGFSPRLTIIHTSGEQKGQIYVPEINFLLLVICVAIVFAFKTASNLAVAYGIAVVGTMTITSILLFFNARRRWHWGLVPALGLLSFCLAIDLPFLAANLHKIIDGAWITLLIASAVFTVMTTWKTGRKALSRRMQRDFVPIGEFVEHMRSVGPHRVDGVAVFMTSNSSIVPPTMVHHFNHNKILHKVVLILCVVTDDVPEVKESSSIEIQNLGLGMYEIQAHFGFMQTPSVTHIIHKAQEKLGIAYVADETTYFLGRESLLTTGGAKMLWWRKALFAFLTRNSRSATAYFGIPPNRVVELGMQVEL